MTVPTHTSEPSHATGPFHTGELEVQERAGVRGMAARIGTGIRSTIPPAARAFLRQQSFVVVASTGPDGRVWASLLVGGAGFARALDERTVRLAAAPAPDDPLAVNLQDGAHLGLLAIDLAARKRMRLNGVVRLRPEGGSRVFDVHTRQVYSNCPKYIQAREWVPALRGPEHGTAGARVRAPALGSAQLAWVRAADTFFIASAHPQAGGDASHRGGPPGFVHAEDERTLLFPDYPGNTMFNTLGNLAAHPHAGLLFVDFESGATLQLTGQAAVRWDAPRSSRFPGAERLVAFRVDEVVDTAGAAPLRHCFWGASPFNPA